MELILISNSKLKIMLSAEDMKKYRDVLSEYSKVRNFENLVKGIYNFSGKRDYARFKQAYNDFSNLKLSREVALMMNGDVTRMCNKLLGDIDVIEQFDVDMESIANQLNRIPQEVRSGKQELKNLPGWIRSVEDLKSRVEALSEDDRELLIGEMCYATRNQKNEYDLYQRKAKDFKELLVLENTFKSEVELIDDFNSRVKKLTEAHQAFSLQLREDKIVFKYASRDSIKNDINKANNFVELLNKVSDYLNLLSESRLFRLRPHNRFLPSPQYLQYGIHQNDKMAFGLLHIPAQW